MKRRRAKYHWTAAGIAMIRFSDDELDVIQCVERSLGRKLTIQEINLSLDQARFIGLVALGGQH